MITIKKRWGNFTAKHPSISQFIVFFILSNGVTLLQLALMPVFKYLLNLTELVNINFQLLPVGANLDGSQFYVFNYVSGALPVGGGGLAYFLAVQITLAIAQVINFFMQRNITFKSNGSILKAAFWYFVAYVIITIGAAALQGLYKAPIYNTLINTWNMGSTGETIADSITMIINSALSFWVFFPIFKIVFNNKKNKKENVVNKLSA